MPTNLMFYPAQAQKPVESATVCENVWVLLADLFIFVILVKAVQGSCIQFCKLGAQSVAVTRSHTSPPANSIQM